VDCSVEIVISKVLARNDCGHTLFVVQFDIGNGKTVARFFVLGGFFYRGLKISGFRDIVRYVDFVDLLVIFS